MSDLQDTVESRDGDWGDDSNESSYQAPWVPETVNDDAVTGHGHVIAVIGREMGGRNVEFPFGEVRGTL